MNNSISRRTLTTLHYYHLLEIKNISVLVVIIIMKKFIYRK